MRIRPKRHLSTMPRANQRSLQYPKPVRHHTRSSKKISPSSCSDSNPPSPQTQKVTSLV